MTNQTQTPDFLNTDFDATGTPQIPAPTLPFFQFHGDSELFEFPLTLKDKRSESPLWSAILRDSGLKHIKFNHNGKKALGYGFETLHFAYLGEHVFWFDKTRKAPGRFQFRPNPQPDGSRFVSRRLTVGLVKEIEAHAPGTLCFLTTYSMQSKFFGQTIANFDKNVLLPAHNARLAQLRRTDPQYPEPAALLYPRYAFWMPIKAGEAVNVAPANSDVEKYMSPIVGGWDDEVSIEWLRKMFVGPALIKKIQSEYMPLVNRWLAWQESRWTDGNQPAPAIEQPPEASLAEEEEIPY